MLLLFLAYADLVPQVLEYQQTSPTEMSGGGPYNFDSKLWSRTTSGTQNGGSINCYTVSTGETVSLTCTNCKFMNSQLGGSGLTGGAVHGRQASFSFTTCIFDTCTATGNGGAINMKTADTLTVIECVFIGCTTGAKGGVIFRDNEITNLAPQSQFIFKDCVVTNCGGTTQAGALIYCTAVTSLEFTNNHFTCSLGERTVSGIDITFATPRFTDLDIRDCTFKHEGDTAIQHFVKFADHYQSMTFNNCTFEGIKSSLAQGSGICPSDAFTGKLSVEKCKFISVDCASGSAIYSVASCEIVISECDFDRCVTSAGGAVYLSGFMTLSMSHCDFMNYQGTVQSLQVEASEATTKWGLSNCHFTGHATSPTYLLSIKGSSTVTGTMNYCEFRDNTISSNGMVELALPVTCSGGVFENNRITGDGSLLVCSAEFTWTGGEWSVPSGVCILTGNSPAPSISLVSITITIVAPESGARVLAATSAIILSSQSATLSSCTVAAQAPLSAALVSYTGQGTITLQGNCFSGNPDESSVYLNVESGSVSFIGTCFDLAKDKSIATGEGVTVTFREGQEEFMFGNCTCNPFKPIDPDNPPIEVVTTSDEDGNDGDEFDSSSSSNQGGDKGNGLGDPSPSKVPLIVGVVVAVVVVIAVVVTLLVLFVFRKRKRDEHTSDNVDEYPDETASSFAGTVELTGATEPVADTTPSPLYQGHTSEDVFGDSMEEDKSNSST